MSKTKRVRPATLEQILSSGIEYAFVPALDGHIRFRPPTYGEVIAFKSLPEDERVDEMLRFICRSLLDDSDNPMFDEESAKKIPTTTGNAIVAAIIEVVGGTTNPDEEEDNKRGED